MLASQPQPVGAVVGHVDGETLGLEPAPQPSASRASSSTTNTRITLILTHEPPEPTLKARALRQNPEDRRPGGRPTGWPRSSGSPR